MIKVFIIVGMVCIPNAQCFTWQPEKVIHYLKKDECMIEGKKLGKEMFDRMNAKGIPARINIYCYEMEVKEWQV